MCSKACDGANREFFYPDPPRRGCQLRRNFMGDAYSMFSRKRPETEDRAMSDLPDDLGIPIKPARPAGQQASIAPLGRNPPPPPPPPPPGPAPPPEAPPPRPAPPRAPATPRAARPKRRAPRLSRRSAVF